VASLSVLAVLLALFCCTCYSVGFFEPINWWSLHYLAAKVWDALSVDIILFLLLMLSMPLKTHIFTQCITASPTKEGCHWQKSAQVVNSHLVCDPTIRQPGFDLPRQQWSLLNHLRTEQGHCGACRRKWRLTDTDLCPCGETQTMSNIVESCPLTILNGGLSRLHSADKDAVSWLTNYGSWNAYEKKENASVLLTGDSSSVWWLMCTLQMFA